MNVRLSLSDMALAGRVHPRTGEPIVPVGFLPNGKAVWPIMGGSGEEDDKNDSQGGADKDSKDDDDDLEGDESDEDGASDEEAKANERLKAKNSELIKEKRAQRDRADQLEKRIKELEEKDLPQVEKLTKQIAEQETQITKLNSALNEAHLQVAFLKDNTYEWHNPGRALQVADLSNVEVDSDGTVNGLKEALEALAKSDPYLVKSEGDKSKDDKKKEPEGKGKTGDAPKAKPTPKEMADAERKKLVDKYPGLRR